MIKDFSDSFKAYLYDRTTSPLFGAFVVSWSVWNYEMILTIFSGWSVDKKIDFIQSVLYPNNPDLPWWGNYLSQSLDLFFYPFISAVVVLWLYPLPSKLVYTEWKKHQINMHNERLTLEKAQIVSTEVYEELRSEYFEMKAKLQSDLRERDEEIEYLQDLINKSKEDEIPSTKSAEPEESSILHNEHDSQKELTGPTADQNYKFKDDSMMLVFTVLANAEDTYLSSQELKNKMSIEKQMGSVATEYYLDKLEEDGLINDASSDYLRLTQKGRKVAVEQKFTR